ncbi:MAG: RNA methyltransferase [Anaerolineales bacterium]
MMDTYFAVTAPGIESITALELARLGLIPAEALPVVKSADSPPESLITPHASDFLHFKGGLEALYRANLHLRTASRILVRLGMPFMARTFPELVEKASRLPWERFLTPGQPLALRVTCHKSKLYHSEAVAERLLTALETRLGKPSPRLKPSDDNDSPLPTREGVGVRANPPQLILARLVDDKCTVSVDSSGELLHRRGYRLAAAKAPLRETLAAAMLFASGWDAQSPLIDPFCGSGTIPIEAALMALGIPPGMKRRFAFMDWPNFDRALWESLVLNHPSATNPPPILASDRDAGAVHMAQENARRAGVHHLIQFETQAVSAIHPPASKGWVVTNPPYGVRVSQGKDLRNLYAQFGNILRTKCPGWRVAILSSEEFLLGHARLKLEPALTFNNGGLRVRLGCGEVPRP